MMKNGSETSSRRSILNSVLLRDNNKLFIIIILPFHYYCSPFSLGPQVQFTQQWM